MIFFRFLLIFIFTMLFLEASIHEDAEDKKTTRWELIQAGDDSSINNVKDLSKKSRVIEFKGKGTKHSYALKTKKTKKNEHWLTWEMKFSEDFVIIVLVETNIGKYHLIYTPGVFKGHMQYGLGYASMNGKWQTVKRNLQEDIAYFDNRVKSVSVKSFVLKGNGKIDNIMTKKTMLFEKKKLLKEDKKKIVFKNSSPIIRLKGARLIQLSLGESYIEEGVSAYDNEDGKINVEWREDVNPYVAGQYMVLYMATDSDGNMAVDKRYVQVGNVQNIRKKVSLDRDELNIDDSAKEIDDSDEEIDFFLQEEQIRMWEKELMSREKKLAEKEKESNKN
jgi:hypothetical protein